MTGSRLLRWPTVLALLALTVVCLIVSKPTKDKGGLVGAISWVTFVGFWVGLVATVVLAVVLLARRAAHR